MRVHAIVLAGGDGNRFGGEMPKQFIRLAGDPILLRTLRALAEAAIDRVVIVAHASWVAETERLLATISLPVSGIHRRRGSDAQREHVERAAEPATPTRTTWCWSTTPFARWSRARSFSARSSRSCPGGPTRRTRSSPAPTRS